MCRCNILLLFLVSACVWAQSAEPKSDDIAGPEDPYTLTVRMDKAVPTRPDDLRCTATKLDSVEAYIIGVEPHASKETAHHMMVYGCEEIANQDPIWDCHLSEQASSSNSVCKGGERQILFAWAMDAPAKSLPEGVGIRVSGATGIKYIVIQLHYANVFPDGVTDNSGVTLTMTHRSCSYRELLFLQQKLRHLSHWIQNPRTRTRIRHIRLPSQKQGMVRDRPHVTTTTTDFLSCESPGYGDKQGDELASRCTMNSMSRDAKTYMGARHEDEMCNFYIMYATYNMDVLNTEYCFQLAPDYQWTQNFSESVFPADASSLEGINGAELVLEHFHMSKPV